MRSIYTHLSSKHSEGREAALHPKQLSYRITPDSPKVIKRQRAEFTALPHRKSKQREGEPLQGCVGKGGRPGQRIWQDRRAVECGKQLLNHQPHVTEVWRSRQLTCPSHAFGTFSNLWELLIDGCFLIVPLNFLNIFLIGIRMKHHVNRSTKQYYVYA